MADDTYAVERSTTIDAAPARVYAQIAGFHNWTGIAGNGGWWHKVEASRTAPRPSRRFRK